MQQDFPGFNAPAAANRAAALTEVSLGFVDDRFTGAVVEGQVDAASPIAHATCNTVEEDHDIVRSVVADAVRAGRRIVFTDGGGDGPFVRSDLSGV